MKRSIVLSILALLSIHTWGQSKKTTVKEEQTLLWRISGKGITSPSYLFGTMHLICATDIGVSDSLSNAIQKAKSVYLELDMDNMVEMMSAMSRMKMNNDTTLADLLTPEDYQKVKTYFSKKGSVLPFSMLERYKPLLAASLVMQQANVCENMISMEQLIMEKAKENKVPIKGMETMAFQMSIFDSIPYSYQAKELMKLVNDVKNDDGAMIMKLTDSYRKQELTKMEELTKEGDTGFKNFTEILLYKRNENWVAKLESILGEETLVIAVGAGHLPGQRGVINLLRKAGYKVEPVQNNMTKKKTKEI